MRFVLLLFLLFLCSCSWQERTWAVLPNGKKEFFTFRSDDCVFVSVGKFYVKSPSNIRVYFSCPPQYRYDPEWGRIPINPFTGQDLICDY